MPRTISRREGPIEARARRGLCLGARGSYSDRRRAAAVAGRPPHTEDRRSGHVHGPGCGHAHDHDHGHDAGHDCASHHHNHGDHKHAAGCGHKAIEHDGHVDFLHDGHLHHAHGDHHDCHSLAVNGTNPAGCTPDHDCGAHETDHTHGPDCGHDAVPHGDHTDYLVSGHLHHQHGQHCDDHGPVVVR